LGVRGGPLGSRVFAILHPTGYESRLPQTIPFLHQARLRLGRTIGAVQAGLTLRKTARYAGEKRGALHQAQPELIAGVDWASLARFLGPHLIDVHRQ
jgi:hypothetical protein